MADNTWLILSRTRRVTKTIRLDSQLLEKIPKNKGALSDMINLGLKKFIESKEYEDYIDQFDMEDAE